LVKKSFIIDISQFYNIEKIREKKQKKVAFYLPNKLNISILAVLIQNTIKCYTTKVLKIYQN